MERTDRAIGGSSGIGWASALLFASKNANVIISDLTPPKDGLHGHSKITFIGANVSSWNEQVALFKKAIENYGRVDVVFANAGIAEGEMAFEDRTDPTTGDPVEPRWSTMDVNLKGLMITVKLALHYMRKTPAGGAIVMTGSRASRS
jgi:NAD(P)-dependent dehydrogenase (short-subunit alcohol dehydrogenase family)